MAHVYILHAKTLNKFYIGSCLNLTTRLFEHQNKLFPNCFTSKDNNWDLFFDIPDLDYKQARMIEKHIKT